MPQSLLYTCTQCGAVVKSVTYGLCDSCYGNIPAIKMKQQVVTNKVLQKIWLYAGGYREAKEPANREGLRPSDFEYISVINLPLGYHNETVYVYGSYQSRGDYQTILNWANTNGHILNTYYVKKYQNNYPSPALCKCSVCGILLPTNLLFMGICGFCHAHARMHPFTQQNPQPQGGQQVIKCKIWWDSQCDAYVVSSSYKADLVAALKTLIPSGERRYDDQTKFWYVKEAYGDMILKTAKKAFGDSFVSYVSKQVAEQNASAQNHYSNNNSVQRSNTTTEDVIAELVKLMPYEALKKAYLLTAQVLHPDKPTGNAAKMARLTELWSRIEKELFKK